jgi:hypothetical protein
LTTIKTELHVKIIFFYSIVLCEEKFPYKNKKTQWTSNKNIHWSKKGEFLQFLRFCFWTCLKKHFKTVVSISRHTLIQLDSKILCIYFVSLVLIKEQMRPCRWIVYKLVSCSPTNLLTNPLSCHTHSFFLFFW